MSAWRRSVRRSSRSRSGRSATGGPMKFSSKVIAFSIVILASTALYAQETKPAVASPAANGASNGTIDQEEYRIGPEDALQIFVWKNETLSRTVSVRPDGK